MLSRTRGDNDPAGDGSRRSTAPSGLPFGEPSRRKRLVKVGAWLVGIALVVIVLGLLGVDVSGWLSTSGTRSRRPDRVHGRRRSSSRPARRVFAGLSYYGILRAAYPGEVVFWPIVTAYAVGVAMNGFLPANIGTFVTLLMFVAIIPAATFPASVARLPGAEDLLHDRRDVRLPVPVPVRPRLVRHELRQPLLHPGLDR